MNTVLSIVICMQQHNKPSTFIHQNIGSRLPTSTCREKKWWIERDDDARVFRHIIKTKSCTSVCRVDAGSGGVDGSLQAAGFETWR